jgi:DNA-binding NarL/FixJ family response regulator
MRLAVIFCLILTAFALGVNWGGFLMVGAASSMSSALSPFIMLAVLASALVTMSPFMREMSDENAGDYSDFSIYTVLSAGMSTELTLLAFSFNPLAGLIGLEAVPLSVGSLIYASVAGAELSGRSRLIETEKYFKEIIAMVVTPTGALLISYLINVLIGKNEDSLMDFTVLSAAMIILVVLVFFGYARRQRRQKEMTERLVHSQQQQIYENSRALNDMQLKVVISENQALHNAVEMKRQEVMNVALSIVEQREYLESLSEMVKKLSASDDEKERNALISDLGTSLKQRLSYDRDVDTAYFYAQAESLHEDFNAKLSENFPDLTQQERRLATLLRLGFSSKYISTLMNITVKSVEISRYRLRQKLGLSKGDNLVNFIKSI